MGQHDEFSYLAEAGNSSIEPSIVKKSTYRKSIRHLEKYRFWNGAPNVRSLWKHQRAAISHIVAYRESDPRLASEAAVTEAALLKLPTGSGKSGIIAIAARCLPSVRRTLILTPRTALSEQLHADISWRFWKNIGFPAIEGEPWSAANNLAGKAIEPCLVDVLLPKHVDKILSALDTASTSRISLVGTLQALDQICRNRDALLNQQRLGTTLTGSDVSKGIAADKLFQHLLKFDLVVIDEGHYEPAATWSRHVRGLNRSTILLSATPFRNDYKSFRVRGRFTYNMPFPDATDSNIVRQVTFHTLEPSKSKARPSAAISSSRTTQIPRHRHPSVDDSDTTMATPLTGIAKTGIKRFVSLLARDLDSILKLGRTYTKEPKIMLRAGSFEALELLQLEINKVLSERSVLIHDRISTDNIAARQFHTVRNACKHCDSAMFWLHQSKLLEGIDDPRYVAIGILDGFSSSRQLVQQIGRALRSTDPSRMTRQSAVIFTSASLAAEMQERWKRYLAFEEMCKANIKNLVRDEAALPERILELMPKRQYVDGDFRERFLSLSQIHAHDLHVPLRVSVFHASSGL